MTDNPLSLETRITQPADRVSKLEAEIAKHTAQFEERTRAETRAEAERVLAAQAVKDALDEARTTQQKALEATTTASGKALEAAAKAQQEALTTALRSANELEVSRIEKVADKVAEVKAAAGLALTASEKASQEQQKNSKETLDHHNELLKQMNTKDGTYATKDTLQLIKETIDARHVVDMARQDREINLIKERLATGGGESVRSKEITTKTVAWIAVAASLVSGAFATITIEIIKALGG